MLLFEFFFLKIISVNLETDSTKIINHIAKLFHHAKSNNLSVPKRGICIVLTYKRLP